MDIFDGFRKHEADEEQASAETLAHLRPMLVGTRWKLRWQHTGGGCSAWELYADGELNAVAVYLTGGEGNDVETGPELTPRERALVVMAYLKRAEKAVERIMPSISAAQDAFFAELAKQWPEANTGDMYPHEQIRFQDAAARAARTWIAANVPTRTIAVAVVVDTPEAQRVVLSDGSWL